MAATASSPSPFLSLSFLLSILVFHTIISSSSAYQLGGIGIGRRVGGMVNINDVESNKEIQDLGKFSVEEYNKNHKTHLTFFKVVEAQKQVVSGIKYYLKIHATYAVQNLAQNEFDAVVVVKAWKPSKELLFFAPSTH